MGWNAWAWLGAATNEIWENVEFDDQVSFSVHYAVDFTTFLEKGCCKGSLDK